MHLSATMKLFKINHSLTLANVYAYMIRLSFDAVSWVAGRASDL